MTQWLYVLLLFFASPLYAKCHDVVVDSAGSADFIQQIQQVTASGRLYLYSAPHPECRLDTFLIKGDPVQAFRESPEYREQPPSVGETVSKYRYISFRDAQGTFVTGWVPVNQLGPLPSLNASASCGKQSDAVLQGPETEHILSAENHYQISGEGRAWFYSAPADGCKSSTVFLVPGDGVSVQKQHAKSGFSYLTYYTQDRRIVQGWIKTDRLVAQGGGDVFRDDINPDPAAKAARQVSLLMSLQGQCKFYESFEDSDDDETMFTLLVREDHQSPGCRGGADPEVSPVVGNIFISEKTGRIYINDPDDYDKRIEIKR